MVKERVYKGQWTSDRAEAKFRAKEAVLWQRATRQPEAIDVATRFGSTRAYHWPGPGAPVVFLHGMTDTSVRWIRYADALDDHDVYAIDVMGEVGHSRPEVGFTTADDYATWLDDALDGLDIAEPHLVGASLGGFIALSYAIRPHGVASIVGFEPVGVVKLQLLKLMRWSLRCGTAAFAPGPIRARLATRLRQPLLADDEATAFLLQAQRGHPIKIPPCPVLTDEQLRSVTAPVHVVAGADSRAFDAAQLVERIDELVPRGAAQLLADAGHALTDGNFTDCLATIRQAIEPSREPEHHR